MRILGLVLLVLGIVGLVYGGITWTDRDTVIDVGPLEVSAEERKSFPIAPLASGVMLVVGAVLLIRRAR